MSWQEAEKCANLYQVLIVSHNLKSLNRPLAEITEMSFRSATSGGCCTFCMIFYFSDSVTKYTTVIYLLFVLSLCQDENKWSKSIFDPTIESKCSWCISFMSATFGWLHETRQTFLLAKYKRWILCNILALPVCYLGHSGRLHY